MTIDLNGIRERFENSRKITLESRRVSEWHDTFTHEINTHAVRFIGSSLNDIPALINEVERLRNELAAKSKEIVE